jgi:hypothetical protein
MKQRLLPVLLLSLFLCGRAFGQPYSHGPREIGEEVLDELLLGERTVAAKVSSGGCTGKGSFRVDVEKNEGLTSRLPHYVLTIRRVAVDECKAIVDDGPVIVWDLGKDLGLTGNYTFSVRNMVYSIHSPYDDRDPERSMLSTVEKQMGIRGAGPGMAPVEEPPKPEPAPQRPEPPENRDGARSL